MEPIATRTSGELQSTVTLGEFLRAWARYGVWFAAGLIVVGLGTFAWVKCRMTTFYRAEASFFVTSRLTPESRAGIAEAGIFKGGEDELFQTEFLATLAEQYLDSGDFLLEVADRMKAGGTDPARLLGIDERDEQKRRRLLANALRSNLIRARKLETSGVIVISGEMPRPEAAALFVNTCLDKLQERFTENEFGYFRNIIGLYKEKYRQELDARAKSAEKLRAPSNENDPEIQAERKAIESVLSEQALNLARMNARIEMLTMATSPEALKAARSITVIDHARPPLRKSRPTTTLIIGAATIFYTFVFMVGLMLIGLLQATPATREARFRDRIETHGD